MEIVFQSHHAVISDRMRERARRAVERLATRMRRAVDAVIRFEQDGTMRRVEIVLHAPRQRNLVARGEGRFFGPALSAAVDHLEAQTQQVKSARKARTRSLARV